MYTWNPVCVVAGTPVIMFAIPPLVQVEKAEESILTVKEVVAVTPVISPERVFICVMPLIPWKVTVVTPISAAVKACVAVMEAFAALEMPVIVRLVLTAPGGSPERGIYSRADGVEYGVTPLLVSLVHTGAPPVRVWI